MIGITRFEEIGAQKQWSAKNKGQALKFYDESCELCWKYNMHIDCDKCAIKKAHEAVMKIFEERTGRSKRMDA